MTLFYPNLCYYKEVCYKGTALYMSENLSLSAKVHKWKLIYVDHTTRVNLTQLLI